MINIEKVKQIVDNADSDLIWLSENVHFEHTIENQWLKKNTTDIGYSCLPNNQNPNGLGNSRWYSGFEVLQVGNWIEILSLRQQVERLRDELKTSRGYIEVNSLIDDIENLCGEDSDELAEVSHLWNLAHEDLSEAKRYAKQVLPKQPKEQDHDDNS